MKVTFKNIGPIREAEVDLSKDLIVLCGGNNTGKTFLAYAVYGLMKEAYSLFWRISSENSPFGDFDQGFTGKYQLDLGGWLKKEQDYIVQSLQVDFIESLPELIGSNPVNFSVSQVIVDLCAGDILEVFVSRAIKERLEEDSITLEYQKPAGSHSIDINMKADHLDYDEIDVLNFIIVEELMQKTISDPIFAPAERFAINLFSKELSYRRSRVLDRLKGQELDDYARNIANYPLPIKDALAFAQQMGFPQNKEGDFAYLADLIQSEILKGKISMDEHGNVQYQPGHLDHSVGIHLSASLVKSLTSIVFYLRYRAKKGDLYIIDEPELNLHPDNQRKVARVLAEMVNAGIKVMISTHSDYIVKELNNLVMLASAEDQKTAASLSEQYGYRKEQLLSPEKVGAYLFSLSEGVKQLEVSNTGFSVETIDEQINELNQSSDDIYFKLHFE